MPRQKSRDARLQNKLKVKKKAFDKAESEYKTALATEAIKESELTKAHNVTTKASKKKDDAEIDYDDIQTEANTNKADWEKTEEKLAETESTLALIDAMENADMDKLPLGKDQTLNPKIFVMP